MAPFPLSSGHSSLAKVLFDSTILKRRDSSSSNLLSTRDESKSHYQYHPGAGTKPPQDINNKAYFALFAILGAGMVITSIWFFFWARNGGFVWRRDDWDDYKSTVLRRKGKDGKTLSNATPATDLGEKSIAGTFDIERDDNMIGVHDFAPRRNNNYHNNRKPSRPSGRRREPSDEDLRAYRHEKPARVGGLNREQDGSHFDFTSTEPSEVVSNNSRVHLQPKTERPKKKGFMEKKRERNAEKKAEKKAKQERSKIDKKYKTSNNAGRGHVYAADEASEVDARLNAQHYRRGPLNPEVAQFDASYRPSVPPHAPLRRSEATRGYSSRQGAAAAAAATSRSRHSSPQKPPAAVSPSQQQRFPGAFDTYSDAGSSDTGTKVYSHHIPNLSRGSRNAGFRRGGGRMGRRDSLSDSENGDLGGVPRRW